MQSGDKSQKKYFQSASPSNLETFDTNLHCQNVHNVCWYERKVKFLNVQIKIRNQITIILLERTLHLTARVFYI